MGALSAVFWGLLVLSLLVFAHEGGHFLAARLFGVRVTEFFLGLPSRWRLSTKSKTYGTEFGVTPFLLGGYNRICGMEGTEDERLADVFACVQRNGRVKVEQLAAELSMEVDDAYALLATLDDWAAVKPYYDEALGEHEGQSIWPEAFETRARDAQGLTEFDKGHDFTKAGSTAAGEPRVLEGGKDAALAHEREHTYLGKGFLQRICMLLAGPAVNIVLAVIIVVFSLSVIGMDVQNEAGEIVRWRPGIDVSVPFAFRYAGEVAKFAIQLLMPTHTMEVLESSSSVVGISVMASEAASSSLGDLALLVASVSMSLGFMNLLPVPPLDGGKILIEVIQLIIRRPLSRRVQNAVSYVGLAFFLFIFVFALRNDLFTYVFH